MSKDWIPEAEYQRTLDKIDWAFDINQGRVSEVNTGQRVPSWERDTDNNRIDVI